MASIKVKLPEGTTICDGKLITFRAPCNCEEITHIIIENEGYDLVDALGNVIAGGSSYCKDAMVSVVIDKSNFKAYIQNAAIEGLAVKSTSTTRTISASIWQTAEDGTHRCTINIGKTLPSADWNGVISVAQSATAEQREQARNALLSVEGQGTGAVKIVADGDKPTVNIPVTIIFLG